MEAIINLALKFYIHKHVETLLPMVPLTRTAGFGILPKSHLTHAE